MGKSVRMATRKAENADYLVSVFESSPVALVSLDTRLRIVMFNRAAEELTGWTAALLAGRRVNRIIRPKSLRSIIGVLRRRGRFSVDGFVTKLIGSGGAEIPVRIVVSPLLGAGTSLNGILLIASDLRQLRRIQGKVLEAERLAALSEIAITINHEINNPLCSILGNTQLLLMERDRLDPRVVRKLRSIEREIARIQEISHRLARITRPVLKEYVGGRRMLDVDQSGVDDGSAEGSDQESV